jgi:ribose/xylose/arabinose/galactoside ABC-type transport system permease subunit
MKDRLLDDRRVHAAWALLAPALLWPATASAAQVGCFFTALFLGAMFVVCIGITSLGKHLLARHVGKLPRTPWLRLFGITWLELLTGVAVFAAVRTSFWITVLIYLPLAALLNRALLGRLVQAAAGNAPAARRAGLFVLFALILPVALQVSGVLWHTLTEAITFTEFR